MTTNRRTNAPEAVRRRIVDAAYDAFTGQGYLATGLLELREKASVSGGAMAHHFPAKRDLGLAVINDRVAEAVETTWIAPLRASADAPTGIDLIFGSIIDELVTKDSVSGCPVNNMAMEISRHDEEMRTALSDIFAAWHETLVAKFQADIDLKRAVGIHPGRLATLVIAGYSGAMAMAKATQDVGPLIDCRAELAALLKSKYAAVAKQR